MASSIDVCHFNVSLASAGLGAPRPQKQGFQHIPNSHVICDFGLHNSRLHNSGPHLGVLVVILRIAGCRSLDGAMPSAGCLPHSVRLVLVGPILYFNWDDYPGIVESKYDF